MNFKSKLVYVVLILMLVASATLFYLNNFYFEGVRNANNYVVYYATKDIPEGVEFINGLNYGYKLIPKDAVLPSYILDYKKIEGKQASANVYIDEPITIKSVSSDEQSSRKFELPITSSFPQTLSEGDTIRIYVQMYNKKEQTTFLFRVMDAKTVSSVRYTKNDTGVINGISSILLLVSDKEALNYHNAKIMVDNDGKQANIIILKYNDLSEKDNLDVEQFELDSPKVKQIINDNAEFDAGAGFSDKNYGESLNDSDNDATENNVIENENENTNGTEIGTSGTTNQNINTDVDNAVVQFDYEVKEGETVDVLIKSFSTTRESLEANNPEVNFDKLTAGLTIKVVVDYTN